MARIRTHILVVLSAHLLVGPAVAIASAALPESATAAATVLGREVRCEDLRAYDADACGKALLRYARGQIERDFIDRRGLTATQEEIAALAKYNRAFARHDRAQRTRKLAQLDERLADDRLSSAQRNRLREFRAILQRLADFDADVDAGIEQRDSPSEAQLRALVEEAKLNIALHARYGGVVTLGAFGLYPHGARTALVNSYIDRGDIVLRDRAVGARFVAALQAAPSAIYVDAPADFTPFWERPLVPSYMSD